jgi:RNase P/RNase MRP subunit p29
MADVLMLAGLHVPVIPSIDTSGNAGAVVFWQYEFAMVGKVGETMPTIVMFKETGVEQLPAVGVNVYVAVPGTNTLILAGLQVPAIPSFDTSGSAGAAAFWQYEFAMVGKVGETTSTIVIFKEAGVEQLPADGVNV